MRLIKNIDDRSVHCNYDADNKFNTLSRRIRRVEILNIFFITFFAILLPKVLWKNNLHPHHSQRSSDGSLLHDTSDSFSQSLLEGRGFIEEIEHIAAQPHGSRTLDRIAMTPRKISRLRHNHFHELDTNQTHGAGYSTHLEIDPGSNHSADEESKEAILVEKVVKNVHATPCRKSRRIQKSNSHHRYGLNDEDEKEDKNLRQTPLSLKASGGKINVYNETKQDNLDYLLPRKLRSRETQTTCRDKNIFRLELQLDQYPKETSWELRDDSTDILVARESFNMNVRRIDESLNDSNKTLDIEPFSTHSFETCIEPGAYSFSLYDHLHDGIECGDPSGCYRIFSNNELMFGGYPFTGSSIVHSFDLSSACISGSTSILEIDRNVTDPEIAAKLLSMQFNQEIEGSQPVEIVKDITSKSTCISSGLYSFVLPDIYWYGETCGSIARPCPEANVYHFNYFKQYLLRDIITGAYVFQSIDEVSSKDGNMCLSPFGCYDIEYNTDDKNNELIFDLNYSKDASGLSRSGECDAVKICGERFAKHHPAREGLNHLTQLVVPNTDNEQAFDDALCWIMTADAKFWEYSICDGTLLERFVLVYFYFSQQLSPTPDILELGTTPTCDWPGVTCDSENKFALHLNLTGKGLSGNVITEIGLLTSLKTIDLSNNTLTGSIYPSVYNNLQHLEVFNIGINNFGGNVPEGLLGNEQLIEFNISNNKFIGTFSSSFAYSQNIEYLDMGNNLLQGRIPKALVQPPRLKVVDVSRNNFIGVIPKELGKLADLRILKLYQNYLSGNIPTEIFNSNLIEVLMLQSNRLNGNIPPEVGNLENATTILVNHNRLKGTIPKELGNLKKLELLHFHLNWLTGIVPQVTFTDKKLNTFISDCGDPSYKLPVPLTCEACTMCCNSEGKCQDAHPSMVKIQDLTITMVLIPIIMIIIFYFANLKKMRIGCLQVFVDTRDPLTIYNDQSAYCFLHSKNMCAIFLYIVVVGMQIFVFLVYMRASIFEIKNTDWLFHYQCLNNSTECIVYKSANAAGWVPFVIIILLYLGHDFSQSLLQLRKGANLRDMELLFSGFTLFFLSALALTTSYRYNTALATKNTDLITNVLILLFVNELDEKLLGVVRSVCPDWTEQVLEQIKENMGKKVMNKTHSLSIVPIESIFSKRQRLELDLLHVSIKRKNTN